MNSRASVTVMVTWVCVKESSNIQSGWREGKVNLWKASSYKSECRYFTFERNKEKLTMYRNR